MSVTVAEKSFSPSAVAVKSMVVVVAAELAMVVVASGDPAQEVPR